MSSDFNTQSSLAGQFNSQMSAKMYFCGECLKHQADVKCNARSSGGPDEDQAELGMTEFWNVGYEANSSVIYLQLLLLTVNGKLISVSVWFCYFLQDKSCPFSHRWNSFDPSLSSSWFQHFRVLRLLHWGDALCAFPAEYHSQLPIGPTTISFQEQSVIVLASSPLLSRCKHMIYNPIKQSRNGDAF